MLEEDKEFNWPLSQLSLKDPVIWDVSYGDLKKRKKLTGSRMNPERVAIRQKLASLAPGESITLELPRAVGMQICKNWWNTQYQSKRRPEERIKISLRCKDGKNCTFTRKVKDNALST